MENLIINKWTFTDEEAERIILKAKQEKYYKSSQWYNSYIELIYVVPLGKMYNFPQWSHVKTFETIRSAGNYFLKIIISVYPFEIYNFDTCLKHNFLTTVACDYSDK